MNPSKSTVKILQLLSFGSVLSVITFIFLSHIGENGIYTYPAIGAIFELLWLPSVISLFALPVIWLVYAYKKKVSWKQLFIPVLLVLGTLLYLLVFFT